MYNEAIAQADEDDKYEDIRKLLERNLKRKIETKEAVDIGDSLVSFYSALCLDEADYGE